MGARPRAPDVARPEPFIAEASNRREFRDTAIAERLGMAQAGEIVERELKQNPDKPRQLEAEARRLRREIEKYVAAVAKADDVAELVEERRKERLDEVERDQAALITTPPAWTPAEIRTLCGEQLRRFDELLRGDVRCGGAARGGIR